MGQLVRSKIYQLRKRSPVVVFLLLLLWSAIIGWGLTLVIELPSQAEPAASENYKSIGVRWTDIRERSPIVPGSPLLSSELTESASTPNSKLKIQNSIGTVDLIPRRYQLGQELYLESCASCHIGLPPAVLPTETWRDLIQDEQHYGRAIKPLVDPQRLLVWDYLRTFSRPQIPDEQTPYRLGQSRYFKALHPQVKLPQTVTMVSCVSCHPGAGQYDFRTLSSEWQNAP
jgi:Dihaem cytochrome c